MTAHERQAQWDLVIAFLHNAHAALAEQPTEIIATVSDRVAEFKEFLARNELELALESLAEAGRLSAPRARFWDSLRQAAERMELHERATDFGLLWVEVASNSLRSELHKK